MEQAPGEPLQKTNINPPWHEPSIGLVLSSNWADFVVKIWQPCTWSALAAASSLSLN